MANITLAQFISSEREKLWLTQEDFAEKANIDLKLLQDIESGMETFLSPSVRQRLTRVIKTEARVIKKYEKEPPKKFDVSQEYIEELKQRILDGQLKGNICPVCKSELVCRVAELEDIYGNPTRDPKAHCSKCTFQLR